MNQEGTLQHVTTRVWFECLAADAALAHRAMIGVTGTVKLTADIIINRKTYDFAKSEELYALISANPPGVTSRRRRGGVSLRLTAAFYNIAGLAWATTTANALATAAG